MMMAMMMTAMMMTAMMMMMMMMMMCPSPSFLFEGIERVGAGYPYNEGGEEDTKGELL